MPTEDDPTSPRESLIAACRGGPVTLFLGAGISYSRGVPLWDEVVSRLLEWVTGSAGGDRGGRARAHPLEPQLTLEWIRYRMEEPELRRELAAHLAEPDIARADAEGGFAILLRRALYEHVPDTGRDDVLAAVAEVVRAEQRRARGRRIVRVVTFNADDVLEREVGSDRIVQPIVRASEYPPSGEPPPIPVYHLHGYLPRDVCDPSAAPDYLVFTDVQFWSTTSNPLSFANRVVANALHDSRCVFAGISMRDVNLMRWLAVRYQEMLADLERTGRAAEAHDRVTRHFWIHVAEDDPTGVLRDVLARRGVQSVRLEDWSADRFRALLHACFAEPT